jgi:inosine-uridine nucleoside N-ribohydrolase
MILLTDIGKDLDDSLALTYAIVSGVPIQAIVCTSKQATESSRICKSIIASLSNKYPKCKSTPIYTGSTKPLKNGTLHDNIYHGDFSRGDSTFKKFDAPKLKKDEVVALGPLTDMVSLMTNHKVKKALFMGQVKKEGWLVPDPAAYNFRCDSYASEVVLQYQDDIPMAFIGKSLAYRMPLKKEDLSALQETGHPVGAFLKDHAFTSYKFFKENVPDLSERLYSNPDIIAYCYDPICILAMTNPELFTFEEFKNSRIAVDIDADKAKSTLMRKLLNGLSS